MVDVAQLVEPRIVIPVVAGSSPVVHPSLIFYFLRLLIFLPQTLYCAIYRKANN